MCYTHLWAEMIKYALEEYKCGLKHIALLLVMYTLSYHGAVALIGSLCCMSGLSVVAGVQVIDLISLKPFDMEAISKSIKKTAPRHRGGGVHEDRRHRRLAVRHHQRVALG